MERNKPAVMNLPPFHLAIPVHDLKAAEAFYAGVLKCGIGRRSQRWIDFNFFGHQLVVHQSEETVSKETNPVDGEDVPVRHFGVVIDRKAFDAAAARIEAAGVPFIIPPTVRHAGEAGEQRTFFIKDPSGNALEFKSMAHPENLFAV